MIEEYNALPKQGKQIKDVPSAKQVLKQEMDTIKKNGYATYGQRKFIEKILKPNKPSK